MKISRKSWHYKFLYNWWLDYQITQFSLCGYLWRLVLLSLLVISTVWFWGLVVAYVYLQEKYKFRFCGKVEITD